MSLGEGTPVIEVPHVQMSHLSLEWRLPAVRRWCESMAQSHRLIRFDNSGGGLSGDERDDFSLDSLASDIAAVANSLELEQFALFGRITGGLPAIVYAAHHPEKVTHLLLWNSFIDHRRHGGDARMKAILQLAASDWQLFTESISQAALGWQDGRAARAWAEIVRAAGSQERFLRCLGARAAWNVNPYLDRVHAKTLVLYDETNQLVSAERSQELAASITDARLLAAAGDAGMPGADAVRAIETFLGPPAPEQPIALAELTTRENEVLAVLVTGASNRTISSHLSISLNTVIRHLTNIYDKLGVSSRSQAIALALSRSRGHVTGNQ